MGKKITATILIILFLCNLPGLNNYSKAETVTVFISVKEFALELSKELGLEVDTDMTAVEELIKLGVIKEDDFTDYDKDLTRGDMLVLLSRADDFVNKPSIDEKLIAVVVEKRISDIKKATDTKKEDIAKGFIKGFLKGSFNGWYIQNRNLKLTNRVTKTGALSCIKMINDKSLRAKLSPDGQLIRTTKLPKYAKYYPYILESFPNAYYDWKFQYEGQVITDPETMISVPYKNIEEYAAPVDMDKINDFDNFKEVKNEYLDEWVSKVQTYMECVFNVDYRTIDDNWVNKLLSADYSNNDEDLKTQTEKEINQYIKDMKKNKTVVESSKVAVDGSSLYYFDGRYILRVYVKYIIVSSDLKYGVDVDTLINENPYGKILFTRHPLVNLKNYKKGEWKEGYFDVEMGWVYNKEPGNIGVFYAVLNELLYDKRRVK
jgi:hypothetical protein